MSFSTLLKSNSLSFIDTYENRLTSLLNLLFSFFILNIGLNKIIEIIGFIFLTIYTLSSLLLSKKKNIENWLNIIAYTGVFILILSSIFSSNIFSVFNISSVKIILMSAVVFSTTFFKSSNSLKKRYLENIGLLIPLICNLMFILNDYAEIDIWDNSRHARNTFRIYDKLSGEEGNKILYSMFYFDFYPNLAYIISQPFIFIFGKSITSIQLCNLFFWLPLGYTYLSKIQKTHFNSSGISISVIGLLIFGNQIVLFYQRSCLLDFSALCLSFPLVYYYLQSEGFTQKRASLYFGLFASLGLLIKATFLIIAAGCIIFYLIKLMSQIIRSQKRHLSIINQQFANIFWAVFIIFLIGGVYYWINYNHFNYQMKEVTEEFGKREGDPYPYSFQSLIYYSRAFIDYFGSYGNQLVLLTFIILFLVFIKKRIPLHLSLLFPLSMLYLSATITWNKDYRTFMPALAFILPVFNSFELIRHQLIRISSYTVCFLFLFFSIINSVTGNAYHYPLISIKNNYMQNPKTPDFTNKLDAFYIPSFMHLHVFDTLRQEKINFEVATTNFTDDLYASKYKHAFGNFNKSDLKNYSKILYVKDEIYSDYYLIGIKKINDTLIQSKILCASAIVRGDIEVKISGKDSTLKDNQYYQTAILNDTEHTNIVIPPNSYNNEIFLKIFHSWPSAQLYDTYYQLMKRINYDNNNMIILNETTNGNKLMIDTLIPPINQINRSPQ
jgi:hypothetical protein